MSLAHVLEVIEGFELFSRQFNGEALPLSLVLFNYCRELKGKLATIFNLIVILILL